MQRNPTDADISKAIREIERLVVSGWSISYARKTACKSVSSRLSKEVSKHPSYLKILNYYMLRIGQPSKQYHFKDGKLRHKFKD